jgi:hypothetical protein
MTILKLFASVGVLAFLAGCATVSGQNFDPRKASGFVPGKSSKAEVLAAMGKPATEQTYTAKKDMADKELSNPAIISEIRYHYTDRQALAKPADMEAARNAFYTFDSGTLMSYWVLSTFADDSTDFDEQLVGKLVRGQTTEAQVIALLARPAGRGVYPAAKQPDGSSMIYEAFLLRRGTRQATYKTLRVYLDNKRVVTDYELNIRTR